MNNFDKRVYESLITSLESTGASFIVSGKFGDHQSKELPIEKICNALDSIGADYEIKLNDKVYTNRKPVDRSKRKILYKELADIFASITPGTVHLVTIPAHMDLRAVRISIYNHFERSGNYESVSTAIVDANDPNNRQIKVFLSPKFPHNVEEKKQALVEGDQMELETIQPKGETPVLSVSSPRYRAGYTV